MHHLAQRQLKLQAKLLKHIWYIEPRLADNEGSQFALGHDQKTFGLFILISMEMLENGWLTRILLSHCPSEIFISFKPTQSKRRSGKLLWLDLKL